MSEDLINISGIERIPYERMYHPNSKMLQIWKANDVQVYILKHSNYGCMITSFEEQMIWFKYKVDETFGPKLTPTKIISFEDLLQLCDERDSVTLCFNLDLFVQTG